MKSDEHDVRDVHATWIAAVNAGDLDRLVEMMAVDVIFLNPGNPPIGRTGFAENFLKAKASVKVLCVSTIENVVVAGDVAYVVSQDSLSVEPRDGSPCAELAGHRMTIYRREASGTWLIARDAHTLAPSGEED